MAESSSQYVPRRLQSRKELKLCVLEHIKNELLVVDKGFDVKLELKDKDTSGSMSVKQLVQSTPSLSGYDKLRWIHR